jgi:hypothetical protein
MRYAQIGPVAECGGTATPCKARRVQSTASAILGALSGARLDANLVRSGEADPLEGEGA